MTSVCTDGCGVGAEGGGAEDDGGWEPEPDAEVEFGTDALPPPPQAVSTAAMSPANSRVTGGSF